MRPRIASMVRTGAGMRRRTGWPTSSAEWRRSGPPRSRSRLRLPIRPTRRMRADQAPRQACAGRVVPCEATPERAQRNFTDPDSRILPTRDGFVQGYNGQIAVDAAHQVIVAHRLVTTSADYRALVPLVDNIQAHLGRKPREVSGDAGFATEANLAALTERRIKGYLPPGRARHGETHAAGRRKLTKMPLMRAMAETLKRAGRRSRYRLRKQVVEPVFGQMKQARGFRQFLRRGLDQVRAEWAMVCTAHNLLKLAKAAR